MDREGWRPAVSGRESLVGRERERAELEAWFESSAEGAGTFVLVGEPGIGKTTLWENALLRARGRGWTVLSARAAQSEVRLTYVALSDLLAEVSTGVLEQLSLPQRRALAVALLRAEPEDGALAQRAVAAGFLAVLGTLARTGPVLVAIDDAQWLDAASASVLDFAARRLKRESVRLLFTQRLDEGEPFPFDRACPQLVRVEVGPLRLGELLELIRQRTGSRLPRRRLAEVERLSGGNPLFALELAHAWGSHAGADGEPPMLPASLGDAVLAQVNALPRSTRDALLVAALSVRPTVRGLDAGQVAPAEEAGIVRVGSDGAISFTHPLFAWAVSASASTRRRRTAHAQAAELTADPEERARQLALAASGPLPELVAELEEVAAAARSRGAPASAADLLAHARRLLPPDDLDGWARNCVQEIPLLLEAGDWDQAWELGQEAIELLPPGPTRAAILLEVAEHRPGAAALCQQALDEANGDPVLSMRAELALGLQGLYGLDASAFAYLDSAVGRARELGEPALLASALSFRGGVRFLLGGPGALADFDEAVGIERQLGGPVLPPALSASCYRALRSMCFDELDGARATLGDLLARADADGDESNQAQLRSFLGVLETRAGNWSRAQDHLENSIALADLMGFTQGSGEKRALLALLQAHQGELDAALAAVSEATAICNSLGDRFTLAICLATHTFIALRRDEPAAAVEHAEHIRQILPSGCDTPVWLDFEGDELEALIALGETAEAERRLDSLERRSREEPRLRLTIWAARGRSLLLASEGKLAEALATLDTLLADHDLTPAPFEHAQTLLRKGQLERRSKHKTDARATLEQSAALFELLGAGGEVQHARAELARLGLRQAKQELTETERRVAELVAAGMTNREIAAALFINRRTVEANVARIYRKLGVRTRAALANQMASPDRHPSTTAPGSAALNAADAPEQPSASRHGSPPPGTTV